MKACLFIAIVIFTTANIVLAQNRDQPSPQPGVGAGGGVPDFPGGAVPGGGGLAPPGQPGLGGGFNPGVGGGGFPGAAGGFPGGVGGGGVSGDGVAGGFPSGGFPGGGMPGGIGGMGGGMGMPGLGFADIPNRFQLFAGDVVPEGKDKPLPMVLKIDTQTGQVWQLQVGAQNKVRFIVIEGQPGQFNGPQRGFGGHPGGVPVDPTTGLPFSGPRRVTPAPQTFQTRPTRPTRQPGPR